MPAPLNLPLKGRKTQFPPRRARGLGRDENWRTTSQNLFVIPDYLDEIKHFSILNKRQIKVYEKRIRLRLWQENWLSGNEN